MSSVLDGLRVLDVGHHIAGPLTARLLADHGADVIRIDRPARVERSSDAYLQAGKRRITLDLAEPGDRAHAGRLASTVDVVVENFRPGVIERLGLGWDAVSADNPGVVFCSLPGFGSADPRAAIPGWEGVIGAATGNCRVRVGEAPPDWDDSRPTYCSLPLASNFAAMIAATTIVAALDRRHRTGEGARIEVPLFDATFELIGHAGAFPLQRGFAIEDPLTTNGSGTYRCADGRFVQFNPIGVSMRFLTWFFEASGHPDWVVEGLSQASTFSSDPGRATELRELLESEFATRPAAEWEALGLRVGVPLCVVRTADEWMQTTQAREGHQVVDVHDPFLGPVRVAGSPITIPGAAAPALVRHRPDEDRDALLSETATAVGRPDRTRHRSPEPAGTFAPFAGLRVVDLTRILAGPSAGRALAEYGADVIKVNAPHVAIGGHGVVNRGKRSILIDLQRDEGIELLWDLIADADVVTENFPPGTAERYGIGYHQVHARFPHVVYVSVSCYGAIGPWSRGRGYEVQGQAVTGIMERTGRGGSPGVLGPYNPLDYGTGAMAALAGAIGIYHRGRTGEGLHISTSLAQTGTYHQAAMVTAPRPDDLRDEPAGRDALGVSATHRFYEAADGWVFVGAAEAQRDELLAVVGVADDGDAVGDDAALAAAIAGAIRPVSTDEITGRLTAAGIGAHPVARLPDLLDAPYVRSTDLCIEQDSPEVGAVVMPGPIAIVDGRRLAAAPVSNLPGGDARAILAELGRHDADDLARRWVVQLEALPAGWPVYRRWN